MSYTGQQYNATPFKIRNCLLLCFSRQLREVFERITFAKTYFQAHAKDISPSVRWHIRKSAWQKSETHADQRDQMFCLAFWPESQNYLPQGARLIWWNNPRDLWLHVFPQALILMAIAAIFVQGISYSSLSFKFKHFPQRSLFEKVKTNFASFPRTFSLHSCRSGDKYSATHLTMKNFFEPLFCLKELHNLESTSSVVRILSLFVRDRGVNWCLVGQIR